MTDRISNLASELRKAHNFNTLSHHIKDILKHHNITSNKSNIRCEYINRNTDECTFCCKIDKNNNLGKEIEIVIKPDHSPKRELRVMIDIGKGLKTEKENRDRPGWNNKKVFHKEVRDAEEYIEEVLEKAA